MDISYSANNLKLLAPPPEERLTSWLSEFYGKPVKIQKRETLRHRDLSFVERLWVVDSLPNSLIYKLVLPPWDIEQDLLERVLIPSISNSAQLYMAAHYGDLTALFMEDLHGNSLMNEGNEALAMQFGKELAKLHRAYSYRTDELMQVGVLRTVLPIDYVVFAEKLIDKLKSWHLLTSEQGKAIFKLANQLAARLAHEPTSLVHGDLYAENIIRHNERLSIIDWSWFTILGVPLMDLATLTMEHPKNGCFTQFRQELIEAYCFEAGSEPAAVLNLLPCLEALSRLLFLDWLVVRRERGIMGTTVGPVDDLIIKVTHELIKKLAIISKAK